MKKDKENNTKNKAKKVPAILQADDPILHTKAKEVAISKIESLEIRQVIKDMIAAMESEEDGIGIAAPQIGISLRIFVVSGIIFDRMKVAKLRQKNFDNGSGDDINESIITEETSLDPEDERNISADLLVLKDKSPHQVFINPVIVKKSKEEKWMDGEGCLSVRWFYGKVKRSTKVTLRAYNEKGEIIERGASGILAHIFQHEVDHLDGILFIDKAKDIQEFDPEEIREEARKMKNK